MSDKASKAYLNRYERLLMQLSQHELEGNADFVDESSFRLKSNPFADSYGEIPLGLYELPRRSGEAHLYRLGHPLADAVVAHAKERTLLVAEVRFDYSQHEGKVTVLEPLLEQAGWLSLCLFTVESLDQAEDNLILAAVTDGERELGDDECRRLFTLSARVLGAANAEITRITVEYTAPLKHGSIVVTAPVRELTTLLETIAQRKREAIKRTISERNARFFEAEAEKLDGWADDLKLGLEREIKELDRQIKEVRRTALATLTLEEKLATQKQVKSLEAVRSQKRRSLFDAQDEVDKQREQLIAKIEGKLDQQISNELQFTIRWLLS